MAPNTLVVDSHGHSHRASPTPLSGEVAGFVDELLVFVVEDVHQVTHTRRQDIQYVIEPLLHESVLRRGSEHIVDYRYLIRKDPDGKGKDTTSRMEPPYATVMPPLRVELYKGRQRAILRLGPGKLTDKQVKQIVGFFAPRTKGYDPTMSRVSYNMKQKPQFEADAMNDVFEGDYEAGGSVLYNIKGVGTFGPDGMPLKDGTQPVRYGPDGHLEAAIDARPRHGAAHLVQGWYRAESGRLEVEEIGTRRFHLICNLVDLLGKTGRIQTGKWTNDPEVFPDEMFGHEVLPFPPDDRQLYVPQSYQDMNGEVVVMISGATGNNAGVINGEYVQVGTYDGRRLFKKQHEQAELTEDHSDHWLRYVAQRHFWMVSDTHDLYVNNPSGWCHCYDKNLSEPWKAKRWRVMNEGEWEEQSLSVRVLISNEARFKVGMMDDGDFFEKKKPTWHRLPRYATFPSVECRVFPIATGRLAYGADTVDGAHMGRVVQGGLDNAYFVEALNAISIRPELVRRLFIAYDCAKSLYVMRLFKNGVWLSVEVDDFVPMAKKKGVTACPLCCRHEHFPSILWPSLVEKAYAKACTARYSAGDHSTGVYGGDTGGWEAIGGGGRVDEALVDLTGGVGGSFNTKDVSPERLFVYLHELQRYCIWSCRVDLDSCIQNGIDLNPYAHYAVNRAVHLQGECFVQLRCVDGKNKHPDVGLERVVSWDILPVLHKRYPGRSSEGYMWLTILDFHQYFGVIFECRLVNSPDIGIAGMPPPWLPIAKKFPDPDWTLWAREHILEHEDPVAGLHEEEDLLQVFDQQHERQQGLTPSQQFLPVGGTAQYGALAMRQASAGVHGSDMGSGAFAHGAGHAIEPLGPRSPVFYEHIFATESLVSEERPPQLIVSIPEVPCEVIVAVEQVDHRLGQIGPKRREYAALLLKVYQRVSSSVGRHGQEKVYSDQLVCKSAWQHTRGAMVAWRTRKGGEFLMLCEQPSKGDPVDRLVMRVYASVPYVDCHASVSVARERLVENPEPPLGVKSTLVGSLVPERLFRVDKPQPLEDDLDDVRRRHLQMRARGCPLQ